MLVHGLFTDGFRWSALHAEMEDSKAGEMLSVLPVMHMLPRMDLLPNPRDYVAPLYKTSVRAGVLSTTGTICQPEIGITYLYISSIVAEYFWVRISDWKTSF